MSSMKYGSQPTVKILNFIRLSARNMINMHSGVYNELKAAISRTSTAPSTDQRSGVILLAKQRLHSEVSRHRSGKYTIPERETLEQEQGHPTRTLDEHPACVPWRLA